VKEEQGKDCDSRGIASTEIRRTGGRTRTRNVRERRDIHCTADNGTSDF
jgi:hypothetical protein